MLGEDGWYSDYRRPPANVAPEPASPPSTSKTSDLDDSLTALVEHWRIVVAELMERGVDLYDPAVRARPWPGVRTLIFSLLDTSPRLRVALRKGNDAEADHR